MAYLDPNRNPEVALEPGREIHSRDRKKNDGHERGILVDDKIYVVKKNKKNQYEIEIDKYNIIKITEKRLEELGVDLETFFKHALKLTEKNEDQLEEVRENESSAEDYIVPTPITQDSQHAFAKTLFKIQAKFRTEKLQKEHNKSFNDWQNSIAVRNRLVIIDPKGISLEDLAERIVNTSTIERLLILNLKDLDQEELKKQLKIKLLEKYTDPENISVIESEETSISHLMGPHLIQDDAKLDKDTIENRFPHLFSPIDGAIFCDDDDEQAAKDFLILCESIDKDIEPVRFRSSPFVHGVASNYTFSGRSKLSLVKLLTSGKSPEEMSNAINDNGNPELTLNPKYSSLLSESEIEGEMRSQGVDSEKHVTKKDINKIKELILDKFLYDPHISPESINPIISGATSRIQIEKSNAVYKELYKNLWQKYSSSAVELIYAVTGMTRDGGSDQVQEGLAESWRYKSFFYSILKELQKQQINEEEAILIAFAQTLDAYIGIEKLNRSIYLLERDIGGAQACRNYSIEHVNKVVKSNEKGLKVLGTAPTVFVVSTALLAVGVLTLIPPVGLTAAAVVFGLATASLGVDLLSRAISGISMYFQKKANKKHLTLSTLASADANLKKNQAQAKRNTLLAQRKKELAENIKLLDPEDIDHEKLGKISTTSDEALEYFFRKNGTKEIKRRWPLGLLGFKRSIEIPMEERDKHISEESRKEIERKMNLLKKHKVDGIGATGKFPEGTEVNRETIREYTTNLFSSMAKFTNLSTTEEHKKSYEKLIHSAEYRSRFVIIETPEKDEHIDLLADNIFKSSSQVRALIVGLNGDKKDRLMNKIRDLLVERLRNCRNFKDEDNNETNDRKFIAHEIASILQRENKLNEIIAFNQKFGTGEVYSEENPEKIVSDFIKLCDNPDHLDALKDLIPEELLIQPHLIQEDNDVSKETLLERYPHFEENIEEMLVVCNDSNVSEEAVKSSVTIKDDPIPAFIIKSKDFAGDDTGNFHCACKSDKDYETVLKGALSGNSASQLLGIEKVKEDNTEDLTGLMPSGSDTQTTFKHVTMSTVFSNLLNLNRVKNKLSKNKDKVCQEDVTYMRTILFDEALYEANMSPNKSTQTISKADSKLAALAGDFIASSLNLNLIGLPQNVIEEVKYAIAFMALDTGVDFEDEILKNRDLYKSIFQGLKNSYLEKNIDSVTATEKAYCDTLDFFIDIKNNPKLKDEKLIGNIARELAYMKVNHAIDLAKETERKFTLLPYISVTGLVLGIASVAILGVSTFGVGLAIPAAVGVASVAIGIGFYAARLGLLYLGLKKNRETNKELIPRSNFFSKDATYKIGDVFKNVKLLKDKLISKKESNLKKEILSKQKSSMQKSTFVNYETSQKHLTNIIEEIGGILSELREKKQHAKFNTLVKILRKGRLRRFQNFSFIDEINNSNLSSSDKASFIKRLNAVKKPYTDSIKRVKGGRITI